MRLSSPTECAELPLVEVAVYHRRRILPRAAPNLNSTVLPSTTFRELPHRRHASPRGRHLRDRETAVQSHSHDVRVLTFCLRSAARPLLKLPDVFPPSLSLLTRVGVTLPTHYQNENKNTTQRQQMGAQVQVQAEILQNTQDTLSTLFTFVLLPHQSAAGVVHLVMLFLRQFSREGRYTLAWAKKRSRCGSS